MTREDNQAIVQRLFDGLYARHDAEVIDEVVAPTVRWQLPGTTLEQREDLKEFNEGSLAALPDLACTLHALLADGDKVAAHWTLVGTHQGPWRGLPATGRRVEFMGVTVLRLADGKIVEGWGVWDTATVLRQLGVLPTPSAATVSSAG